MNEPIPDPVEDANNAGLESCSPEPRHVAAPEDVAGGDIVGSDIVGGGVVGSADSDGDNCGSADLRMAQVLSGSSNNADLRRKLQGEATDEASDLLSRLNALDFVQQVVGGHNELPDRIAAMTSRGCSVAVAWASSTLVGRKSSSVKSR